MIAHTRRIPVDLYKRALSRWGVFAQMQQCLEECAELIVAINHFGRGGRDPLELVDEVADVEIMCEQMRVILGEELVQNARLRKLARLTDRIIADENKDKTETE